MGNYRRRMIWPSIASDPHVQKLPAAARWLFVCHILTADDQGRGDLGPEDWKAFAFPQDPGVSEEQIEREFLPLLWAEKRRKGRALVEPYEVDGRIYWFLPKWRDYQKVDRPSPSVLPDPAAGRRPGTRTAAPAAGPGAPAPSRGGRGRNGQAPTPDQWELLYLMAAERGLNLARVAGVLGIPSLEAILARDVTRIRQKLEESPKLNGQDGQRSRVARYAREARLAVQLREFERFASILQEVEEEDWPAIRAEIKAIDSQIQGATRAEVYESTRRFHE